MSKIVQRLLVFGLGVPLFFLIVLGLPHDHHLVLNVLVIIFSALGALEFSAMLAKKQLCVSKPEAAILGGLAPLAMTLTVSFGQSDLLLFLLVSAGFIWLLVSRIFSRADALDTFLNRLAAGFAVLIYPGMPMAWLVRMSLREQNASIIIITFLAIIFAGDGAAWATGMLFGKSNRGLIPVSPNKSVAGFIGGTLASIAVGVLAVFFCPDVFVPKNDFIQKILPLAGILLGLLTGVTATLGDLAESAIKRSAGVKDSGNLIPGRGGVLDSLDSIALGAPVFYLVFSLFFTWL